MTQRLFPSKGPWVFSHGSDRDQLPRRPSSLFPCVLSVKPVTATAANFCELFRKRCRSKEQASGAEGRPTACPEYERCVESGVPGCLAKR